MILDFVEAILLLALFPVLWAVDRILFCRHGFLPRWWSCFLDCCEGIGYGIEMAFSQESCK